MILRRIHIKNYRAYKDFECDFDNGINLVIGDNGAGKTSLLAAVTQLLSVQLNEFGGALSLNPTDPYVEVQNVGDATMSIMEKFPVILSGLLKDSNGAEVDYEVEYNSLHGRGYRGNANALKSLIERTPNACLWPLINYQSFDRIWNLGKSRDNVVTVETGYNERKDGYLECLTGCGQEERIQRWCLKMSMFEFERKKPIHEFERFKHIVKTFLETIEEDTGYEVSYSTGFSGLVIQKGDEITPLYELSTGYKALLSMIMELAYRSVLLNPDMNIEDNSQNGIVIIDEIDAHLHPKWQWRIIEALENCFPDVQFIIATHSPIVIASAKDARLIDLEEKGKVSYSDGAYGYNVADVLELKQGSASMSKVFAGYLERLEKALDDGNIAQADQIVAESGKEFGTESPVYKELCDYLEVNRWVEDN